jgi:hypothetical protein
LKGEGEGRGGGRLKGKEGIIVSCRTGLRARVAYSILVREGINSTIFAVGTI